MIYTVSVLKFPATLRLWGYELTFEEAEKKVLENFSDLFECYYTHAVIEQVSPGVPACPDDGDPPPVWYRVENYSPEVVVKRCDPPLGHELGRNYGMG